MEAEHNAMRVMQTVWPWRQKDQPPVHAAHRTRAAIEFAIAAAIGLAFLRLLGKPWIGAVVLVIATLTLVGGFLIPPLYRGFHRLGARLGAWAGIAATWVLLVPFFYIFFGLGHAFLALRGKDPLHRGFDKHLQSYWSERPRNDDPARYAHQY